MPALFDTSDVPVDSIGISGSIAGQSDPNAFLTINSLGLFGDTGVVVVNVSWLVSNLSCKGIDDVQITFYQQPNAQAGLDDTVCGYTYQFQSERSIDSADASLWTVYDGPTLSGISYIPNPPVDTNTIVNVPQEGTYEFIWTERNPGMPGTCYDKDTVAITFLEAPDV
ncbi:MAG: hypothetical protein C0594_00305, partial [Marinilabiliales bacterium]